MKYIIIQEPSTGKIHSCDQKDHQTADEAVSYMSELYRTEFILLEEGFTDFNTVRARCGELVAIRGPLNA